MKHVELCQRIKYLTYKIKKKMKNTYKKNPIKTNGLISARRTEGITVETLIERIVNNQNDNETIKEQIFTERKDGIMAGYDIRTDRMDVALEAMDKSAKSMTAKRQAKMNIVKEGDENTPPESVKDKGIQGTE